MGWNAFHEAPEAAAVPSFDCSTTNNIVDLVICATPTLSVLDAEMALVYKAAISKDPAHKSDTKNRQIDWWKHRQECARLSDPLACLENAFRSRIAELSGGSVSPSFQAAPGVRSDTENRPLATLRVNGEKANSDTEKARSETDQPQAEAGAFLNKQRETDTRARSESAAVEDMPTFAVIAASIGAICIFLIAGTSRFFTSRKYYQELIDKDETRAFNGRLHWIIYSQSITLFFIFFITLLFGQSVVSFLSPNFPRDIKEVLIISISAAFFVPAIINFANSYFKVCTTEIVVTNKRIIYKTGFISRNT